MLLEDLCPWCWCVDAHIDRAGNGPSLPCPVEGVFAGALRRPRQALNSAFQRASARLRCPPSSPPPPSPSPSRMSQPRPIHASGPNCCSGRSTLPLRYQKTMGHPLPQADMTPAESPAMGKVMVARPRDSRRQERGGRALRPRRRTMGEALRNAAAPLRPLLQELGRCSRISLWAMVTALLFVSAQLPFRPKTCIPHEARTHRPSKSPSRIHPTQRPARGSNRRVGGEITIAAVQIVRWPAQRLA